MVRVTGYRPLPADYKGEIKKNGGQKYGRQSPGTLMVVPGYRILPTGYQRKQKEEEILWITMSKISD